jgi:hypothetical protein
MPFRRHALNGKEKALSWYVAVSSPQHGKKYSLFLQLSPWRNA